MFAEIRKFHDLKQAFFASLNQVPPFGDVGTNSEIGDGDNYDSCGIGENTPDSQCHPYE
eukprot:CAMPEP_0114178560 /NCGR_PEP_ID=MMETSP0043_2-20121206/38611_1 /TAXON_ID=464988 /ORGANISM="Hemiselmis andersenii, Strain CCMP644" /LENGTH=58 /DNA_ID=CAMNT_0001276985 /DNA_START=11 /DNA_END=187 /DNA_ORIENTATION=-